MKKSICLLATLTAFSHANEINLQDVNIDASLYGAGSGANGIIKKGSFGGSSVYTDSYMENSGLKDGTISSVIKKNPNARIQRGERTSKNSGEISPENITINGASFYQNNFLVDGISINNDIDPRGSSVDGLSNTFVWIPNPSQGQNIDISLLESVEVIDSAVSAKYGNFQGGVISAKTKDPSPGFSGKISYSFTSDRMTKFHIDDEDREDWEYPDNTVENQPKFKKQKASVLFDGYITDNFGLIFNYTRTNSDIYQRASIRDYFNPVGESDEEIKLRRKNENFFVKGIWHVNDDFILRPSFTYAPYSGTYNTQYGINTMSEVEGGGLTYKLESENNFKLGTLRQTLSYQTLENNKKTNSDVKLFWYKNGTTIKDSMLYEGVGGDMKQEQETFTYKFDFDFNEFEIANTKHRVSTGFEFIKTDAKYEIGTPYYQGSSSKEIPTGSVCSAGDRFCNNTPVSFFWRGKQHNWSNGQYFNELSKFEGTAKADLKQYAFYLEDEIDIERFTFRAGVRFDKNDYMGDLNVAPRLSFNADVFDDDSFNIFGGYGRYYGRSIFSYKLNAEKHKLWTEVERDDPNSDFKLSKKYWGNYKFDDLDVPYDDEYSLGFAKKFGNYELSGKYVKRQGRDLIRRINTRNFPDMPKGDGKELMKDYNIFTNLGKSDSDIYTVTFRNLNDIELFNTLNGFELSYSYLDTNRNYSTYDESYEGDADKVGKVVFNGKLIRDSELPKNSNDTPWTVTATTITKFPSANLTWANFFNLQGGFEGVVRDGRETIDGKTYTAYKTKDFDETFVWDTKFILDIPTQKGQEAYVSLDIYNVLDTDNAVSISSGGIMSYDTGRQFWLEVGYRW
ncbi:MAG: TonB-dependent receptor [Campylobacteraceae bacterium]|nr:TonB-dependent receptor [Campylobacteraceae bacterium]